MSSVQISMALQRPEEDGLPPQRARVEDTPYDSTFPSTGPHALEAIDQELAELDAEEKVAMEPISHRRLELKRLWNRSLLIHKLSDELLVKIFAHFPHTPRRRQQQYANGQPVWLDLGWPCLMLVCRRWRDLLVSTRAFWRRVNLIRQASWTKLCLSRSAAGSIDVRVNEDCDPSRLDDLRPHVHRFRNFRCVSDQFDDAPLVTALASLFNSGMPLLENLHFNIREVSRTSSTPQIDAQITSQRFPSLRALTLMSAIMVAPQETSLYAQLRRLTLSDCPPALSLDGFLDALAASAQLEALALQGTLDHLSGEWSHGSPVPHRPPVSLPRLRSFTLNEYRIDRMSYFLAHLHLQPSVVHWIRGRDDGARPRGAAATTIHAMLPPNRSATLPVLALATKVHMTICTDQYVIGSGRVRPYADRSGDSPRVLLALKADRYACDRWDRSMAQGLDDLVESFGSSPLTRLTVKGDQRHATTAAWERVFRMFPLLEELDISRVRRNDSSDVSDVFRGLHAASTAPTDSVVACPNLKDIRVEGTSTVATFEAMRDCFRYRGERGVILESLNIESLSGSYGVPSVLRRGFFEDMSDMVKFIQAGHMLSDLEGGEHEGNDFDDGWDEA